MTRSCKDAPEDPKAAGKATSAARGRKAVATAKALLSSPGSKLYLICGSILILLCLCSYFTLGQELKAFISEPALFQAWLDQFGMFDELVFILLRAAQTIVKFIPAEPLEIGAGYAWGAVPGMVYCVSGNLIGTLCIIALSKRLGLKIIKLFHLDQAMQHLPVLQSSERVYALLFILYLIPGTPKDSFTYLVSLLPVKPLAFMLITAIARIPSVLSSTLCGANLARHQYWVSALIFAVTIIAAIAGGMAYRAYAKRKADPARPLQED